MRTPFSMNSLVVGCGVWWCGVWCVESGCLFGVSSEGGRVGSQELPPPPRLHAPLRAASPPVGLVCGQEQAPV